MLRVHIQDLYYTVQLCECTHASTGSAELGAKDDYSVFLSHRWIQRQIALVLYLEIMHVLRLILCIHVN
uniref:Uncharacterized protein n=1 Tax=Oryza brachyantha TaxID=4533 RepID=J3L0S0_ORYBR